MPAPLTPYSGEYLLAVKGLRAGVRKETQGPPTPSSRGRAGAGILGENC
jgi:hypothetical protein